MIVTFNPMINTGASADAGYMNFLRCVTAIMTAAAGTSTLTVNPFTNNTGTIDNTKNCIVSIDANTEAGGWTTSASHSIVNSGAFTSPTTTSQLYKADFYNATGKSAMPYNKMTFTNYLPGNSTLYSSQGTTAIATAWPTYGGIMIGYGCSTTSDLTNTNYTVTANYPTSSAITNIILNGNSGHNGSQSNITAPALIVNNTNCYYRMAVTANYCILWEVPNNNSYANGYSGLIGPSVLGTYVHVEQSYGTLFYMGTRETQSWENSLNHNPPWTAFQVSHTTKVLSNTSDAVASYMATLSDTGVASSTSLMYYSSSAYSATGGVNSITNINTSQLENAIPGTMSYTSNGLNSGLKVPIFLNRDNSTNTYTNQFHMPVSDPNTGTLVPPAIPIVARRYTSGSWNNGGACRGIYKSLSMPLSTMKLYFSNGQTFTVGSDTYIPIVFNETMYLIRNA